MGADEVVEEGYFEGCIGAEITAVEEDDGSVLLFLSDGSCLEFFAAEEGFGIQLHYDKVM